MEEIMSGILLEVFGKEVAKYKLEIKNALEFNGKYTNDRGMIFPEIVNYVNAESKSFIGYANIENILSAFIKGVRTVDVRNLSFIEDPKEILRLAKEYIDEFNKEANK